MAGEAHPRVRLGAALLLALWGCDAPDEAVRVTVASPPAENADAAAEVLFVDAADAAGLDFTHFNGMTGKLAYAEMMGSGVALLDFDRDGDLDVYLVQGNLLEGESASDAIFEPPGSLPLTDRLFRNDLERGEGLRFTDVTDESGIFASGYGMGVVAADFDNDGWTDLYVTNLKRNQFWLNRGDGAFRDATDAVSGIARWSVPAVAFDYDRDGWLDLYVGNYVDFSPATDKRCADELGAPNYCGPLAFAPEPDNLLHNLGGGRFEDVSREAGIAAVYGACLGAVATDADEDGWLDLYVGNDGTPNQLWMGSPAGRFENRAVLAGVAVNGRGVPEASMGLAAADVDSDGDEDLFLTHLTRETNTLYLNDSRGLFLDRSDPSGLGAPSWSFTGFGGGFLDVENDGRLDLLAVNGAVKRIKELALAGDPHPLHQPNQLFRQRPDGGFEDATGAAGPAFRLSEVSRGAAFGDLDNDGDTDVVISNNAGPARLLLNQVGQDRPWLGLRLVGQGGRDLLGARAGVVFADGSILWRRAAVSWSYASSNDPRLLFGLGDRGAPERILVDWPDSRREEFPAPSSRAYATLEQGGGRHLAPEPQR